jgi:four helix bundle protein
MAKIEKFQDLRAWQEARTLLNLILRVCKKEKLNKDYSFSGQIRNSAISIMANIAEGFGRFGLKDSKNFYIIARGSLTETQSHIYALKDAGYLNANEFNEIFAQTILVSKVLNGLILAVSKFMKQRDNC